VAGHKLAKTVVLHVGDDDRDRFLCIVVPATVRLHLGRLRRRLGEYCSLATERDVTELFPDCDPQSVPACAQAYGLSVLLDQSLHTEDPVFIQSGNRALLLRLNGGDFRKIMADADVL
jgi:Ala-tRNA(Pro) deacylase